MKAKAEDYHHGFFEAMSAIRSTEEAERFLKDLCTPAELQAMADRWHVVAPIKAGHPYRKIYEQTGVSVTTIGRVARFISHGHGGYDLVYKRVKQKKNVSNPIKNRPSKKGQTQ